MTESEHPVAFTASGSEYFRIWIVNLLLIIVTLGLYLPFAKARRLRYFYANPHCHSLPRRWIWWRIWFFVLIYQC